MKENPLVTIALPTYNRSASFLKWSLEAALRQDYPKLEILVSDNCSDDNTAELVHGYRDSRVIYHRHRELIEAHENANYCLERANGKYFLLLHDDDLIDPGFIGSCVAQLLREDRGFVQTGARVIDAEGRVVASRESQAYTGVDYFTAVLEGLVVTYFCNTLYHTERLKAIGGLRSKGNVYNDIIANLRIAHMHGRATIGRELASYRLHNQKFGASVDVVRWCDDARQMIEVMCELIPDREQYFRKEGMARMCSRICAKKARHLGAMATLRALLVILWKFRCLPLVKGRTLRSSLSERFRRRPRHSSPERVDHFP